MFQAGAVVPSCSFLLQLLVGPGDPGLLVGLLVGLHRPEPESPVRCGMAAERPKAGEGLLVKDLPRSRVPVGVLEPVPWGVTASGRGLGPMAVGKFWGLAA